MSEYQESKEGLKTIEIETQGCTKGEPNAAVIWLHGLGASGDDFVPVVPELKLSSEFKIRFIFPFAPQIPVTINGGMVMPAWYDILEMSIDRKVDREQLEASAAMIDQLVEQEISRGIDSSRIILAGFSQGGAVAYQLALSSRRKFGGLMALSTYFATKDSIELSSESAGLPVAIFHGSRDPVVPEALGRHAAELLKGKNYPVQYKTYPMDHSVCLEEIRDISEWLQEQLPPN